MTGTMIHLIRGYGNSDIFWRIKERNKEAEKCQEKLQIFKRWLDIDPSSIGHILITHQDTDHVGAVERDSDGLFRKAKLYISEIGNRYMTGEVRRKVIFGLYKLPMVKSDNERELLKDGDVFYIDDIKVEAILVPGHTWGIWFI